ncbi:MAG: hypothetical protein ACSHWW_07465 [Nonlabens sp.]|uniref:hypothetical protein n=1 Tax=Nonlabens sp. TaxID=1888209 RepID=UPI003EF75B56
MKKLIYIFSFALLFMAHITTAQSLADLKGDWKLDNVTFSGPTADRMDDEDKKIPCLEQSLFVFTEDEITSNLYSGDECDVLQSETVSYRFTKDNNIEVLDKLLDSWEVAEIKNFKSKSFLLIYKEEELTLTISLIRK